MYGSVVVVKEKDGKPDTKNKYAIKLDCPRTTFGRVKPDGSDVIPLRVVDVSRQHAVLEVSQDSGGRYSCTIEDLGSSNGTKVNGIDISSAKKKGKGQQPGVEDGKAELKSGVSQIQLGSVHIVWYAPTDKRASKGIRGSSSSDDSPMHRQHSAPITPHTSATRKRKKMEEDSVLEVFTPLPCQDYPTARYLRFSGSLWGIADEPSSRDLSQGSLCNCYLVAALGVLADNFKDSIKSAIQPYQEGVYMVVFKLPTRGGRHRSNSRGTDHGKVEKVIVDDCFFVEEEEKPKKKGGKKGKGCKQAKLGAGKRMGENEQDAAGKRTATKDALYMSSDTEALWPMLIEKAWIKLLDGCGYGDICPDGRVGFEAASRKNISPHAGCVVKCFTGIDYQMKRFEDQSDEEVWQDIQLATRNRRPCFVGTKEKNNKNTQLYDNLAKTKKLRLFPNHCYSLVEAYQQREGGHIVRYVTIQNPHNRQQITASRKKKTISAKAGNVQLPEKMISRDFTLAVPAPIHRMSTTFSKSRLDKDVHGQKFHCTVSELRQYFLTYEINL